jgi:hypothetical protein
MALRIEERNLSKYENSRIITAEPNPEDIGQLFMVEFMTDKADSFEIVNCQSTFVFDEESDLIRLKPGRQYSDQLFAVVKANVVNDDQYYWIKTSVKGGRGLIL